MSNRDDNGGQPLRRYGALLARIATPLDALLILGAMELVLRLTGTPWDRGYLTIAGLNALLFFVIASFSQLYRSWRFVRIRHELMDILLYWCLASGFLTVILYFTPTAPAIHKPLVLYWLFMAFFLVAVFRCVLRLLLRYVRAYGHDHRNVAFIGATTTAIQLAEVFRKHPWMGIDVRGFFDDRSPMKERPLALPSEQISGNTEELLRLAREGVVDSVYIALPMEAEKRIRELIDRFSDTTVSVYYCPSLFSFDLLNARLDDVFGQPVISIVDTPFRGRAALIKRTEDLVLGGLLLALSALPMLLVAIAIKATSPGPVFYRQTRYGLDGREFRIWKFRSMYCAEDDRQFVQAKKGDARITPLGAFLRKTSLDELPQLFNVIVGDMSLVGPRPHPVLLNETHRRQIRRYMVRHKIKPGITGLAQVNGFRGETDTLDKMEKRIEYDLEYMKSWSLWLDIKIILRTALLIRSDQNAY